MKELSLCFTIARRAADECIRYYFSKNSRMNCTVL